MTSDHHQPHFQWSFLHPRYWGLWLGLLFALFLAFWPSRLRDRFAAWLGRSVGRRSRGARFRARVNLKTCFPDWDEQTVEQTLDRMFERAAQVMLSTGTLAVRSPRYLERRIKLRGEEHLQPLLDAGKPVVLMVPHSWAIEFPGVLIASRGHRWTTMMNPNPNPMLDWMMLLGRNRFQGKMYTRKHGIKAMLAALRDGHTAYYLPDQDHGMAKSEYVPFFATYKATLPGLGRMIEATGAVVVPLFATYNPETGLYEGHIRPAMLDLPSGDPAVDARRMNEELEAMIAPHPEQYMWILKILRSRPEGEIDPYTLAKRAQS
ncbi:lauroyl-Kdo(2)-lipid IV(A) myristoyltransferase [Ferrimonas pelagia]|uniref:lauroyl-Kdo(2)-lipid IV(A) myristoyltransferase n=1 Tax=Ferrimonas pelagia TaxID=1177826 RepID=UPI0031F02E2B